MTLRIADLHTHLIGILARLTGFGIEQLNLSTDKLIRRMQREGRRSG